MGGSAVRDSVGSGFTDGTVQGSGAAVDRRVPTSVEPPVVESSAVESCAVERATVERLGPDPFADPFRSGAEPALGFDLEPHG